ncbi:MAG: ATP-binding cassette domain-containing protein [Lachnospiraceae bacterium]|nr:ATP-binding cassette domain-containing protein [Lachnospiraceae bacterium]
MDILVKGDKLRKYFQVGPKRLLHAVDDVDVEIPRGTTLGVVGESGCGKSTLARVVLGLIPKTGGKLYFDGRDLDTLTKKEKAEYRRQMQIIFQDPYSSLDPRMSVYESIAEPLDMNHVFSKKAEKLDYIMELMERVGLAARFINAYPHEMDGGRRQRVCIARALALNPQFIVCDEPVSALDVSIQAQILNLLMDMQDSTGLTYMFITHDMSVVKHISNEIMVMYLGQCVERAPSKELFENPLHPYTQALLSAVPKPVINRMSNTEILRGEVSNPINPPVGCRFAPRCKFCTEACTQKNFELADQGNRHSVACRLFDQA